MTPKTDKKKLSFHELRKKLMDILMKNTSDYSESSGVILSLQKDIDYFIQVDAFKEAFNILENNSGGIKNGKPKYIG